MDLKCKVCRHIFHFLFSKFADQWFLTSFLVNIPTRPTLLVLVKSFSSLFAQFALCDQFVEHLNLGEQRVAGILRTPTCN